MRSVGESFSSKSFSVNSKTRKQWEVLKNLSILLQASGLAQRSVGESFSSKSFRVRCKTMKSFEESFF